MKRNEAGNIIMDLFQETQNKLNADLQLVRNMFSPIDGLNLQLSYLFAIDAYRNLQNGSFVTSKNPICIINLCKTIGLVKYKAYSPKVGIPYTYYFIWNYETDEWYILDYNTKIISKSNFESMESALKTISKPESI